MFGYIRIRSGERGEVRARSGAGDEARQIRGLHHTSYWQYCRLALVDAALPPIISFRGHSRGRRIWIDDAHGVAARCRPSALLQRGIGAFDVGVLHAVDLQADRIVRIIRLGPSRRRR